MAKFSSKHVYMTKGVRHYMDCEIITPMDFAKYLHKHFNNLGEECKEDNKLNEEAIEYQDGRVVSVFFDKNTKIYVITEGFHLKDSPEYGKDYPMTTVLLAEEY